MDVAALAISILTLIWTAGWSTYSFRSSRRPAIRVGIVFATTPELHGLVAYLSNTGTVETTIPYAALEVEGCEGDAPLEQRHLGLPLRLVPGRYEHRVIAGGAVVERLTELKPKGPWTYRLVLTDHTTREHRSNWLDLDRPTEVVRDAEADPNSAGGATGKAGSG